MLMNDHGYCGRQQRRPEEVIPALIAIKANDAIESAHAVVAYRMIFSVRWH